MKVAVVYNLVEKQSSNLPLPSNWNYIIRRFFEAYRTLSAGVNHNFYICVSGDSLSLNSKALSSDLNYGLLSYFGKGWDIGSYQFCAKQLPDYDIVFFLNSQAFPVYDNWLMYFVEAYKRGGMGLYGASSSFQITPHIRTAAFAVNPKLLLEYPIKVESRYEACIFEHSPHNFSQWVLDNNYTVRVVMLSGEYELMKSRVSSGAFRKGYQEDLLVQDRHTIIFDRAEGRNRTHLTELADGKIPEKFHYQNKCTLNLYAINSIKKIFRSINMRMSST